jgi:hypothetical protein
MERNLLLWLLVPLATWMLVRTMLVAPEERQLAQAQMSLLTAERDELAAGIEVEREELTVQRMKRRVATMISDASRLRAAEQTARAELGDTQGSGTHRRRRGAWKMHNRRDHVS